MSRNNFKLKSPMKIDPVPRYEVPFTPDNVSDDSGLVAKANKNGTMIVNKNIPKGSPLRKEAEAHEDHHLKDMMDGKLDYDDNAVYHNLDGKGVKMVKRGTFQESDKNLAWEKDAYKAGDNLEEKDMRPNPNKLDEVPNMYEQDTPMAFIKQMGRERRKADQDKVSMSERFGTAMVKKFGCGPQANVEVSKGTDVSGNVPKKKMGEWGPWQPDPNNPKREVRYREGEDSSNSKPEYRVKAAISGGKAGAGYDQTMIKMLEDGKTYEEIAAAGHGTAAGLRARFEGKFTPPSNDTVKINEEQERFKDDPPETPTETPPETPTETPPTRDSSISVRRNKVFDGSGIRKIKKAGRNFKTKLQSKKVRKPFKYKGNSYKCPY